MAPRFEPVSGGPLRLRRITCSYWPSSLFPRTPTAVSPDGDAIARFVELSGLYAVGLGGDVDLPVYSTSRSTNFARMERTGRSAFQWDVGSRAIWTATQDRVVPGGWTTGPMRPVLAHISGTVERFRSRDTRLNRWMRFSGSMVGGLRWRNSARAAPTIGPSMPTRRRRSAISMRKKASARQPSFR